MNDPIINPPFEFRSGMMVKIDEQCLKTDEAHTLVPEMKKFLGSVQKITAIDSNRRSARICGFIWAMVDLIPASEEDLKPISKNKYLFDPESLTNV